MSKIFGKGFRVSPIILGAILGFANNSNASEALTTEFSPNQIAVDTDKIASSLKQKTHTPKTNTLTQVMPVSQQLDVNPISIPRVNLITTEAPVTKTVLTQLVPATDQPTSTQEQINQYTQKFNLTLPNYSLRAKDLLPKTSSPVPEQQILLGGGTPIPGPNKETPPTGESVAKNKNQYNLFHPTPSNLLREFSTDRPNLATSPLTVDAGHFYIEADVVNYTRKGSDEDGNTREKFLFASTTLRAGLTNNVEFRLLFQPYNLARTTFRGTGNVGASTGIDTLRPGLQTSTPTSSPGPGKVRENSGIDTLQAGLKINIYGNDNYKKSGDTAFGLFPFINIPTARNGLGSNSIEGGLSALFIYKISDELDVEVNSELDTIKNGASAGYHIEPFNVVSLDYQVTKPLGTFFEIASRFNNESRFGAIVTFDTGLLINLGDDNQIDVGAFIGLTRAADDINPYLGFSKRF